MNFAIELFSSFIFKSFEAFLVLSLGGNDQHEVPKNENMIHLIDKPILHLFKKKNLRFFIGII